MKLCHKNKQYNDKYYDGTLSLWLLITIHIDFLMSVDSFWL